VHAILGVAYEVKKNALCGEPVRLCASRYMSTKPFVGFFLNYVYEFSSQNLASKRALCVNRLGESHCTSGYR
jgi:hypothetical protein